MRLGALESVERLALDVGAGCGLRGDCGWHASVSRLARPRRASGVGPLSSVREASAQPPSPGPSCSFFF